MPQCKSCKEVVSAIQIDKNGMCEKCRVPENYEKSKKEMEQNLALKSIEMQNAKIKGKKQKENLKAFGSLFLLVIAIYLTYLNNKSSYSSSDSNEDSYSASSSSYTSSETSYQVNTNSNYNSSIQTKKATPACPTEARLQSFIQVGEMVPAIQSHPECQVLYRGTAINKVLEKNWSTAKVLYTDINGHSQVMYVTIESIR